MTFPLKLRLVPLTIIPASLCAFGIVLLFKNVTSSQHSNPKDRLSPPSVWRTQNKCGVNCTYIVAKLNSCNISYNTIEDSLPVRHNGSSLLDIKHLLEEKGLECSAIKTDPVHLGQCEPPIIVHWEEDSATSGHFVVITFIGRGWLEYIDGTTAALSVISLADFSKKWTGYAMLVRRKSSVWMWIAILMVLNGLVMLALLLRAAARHKGAIALLKN